MQWLSVRSKNNSKIGYIYLFKAESALKLGHSINVEQRLKSLSRWDGELILLIKFKGSKQQERELHDYLRFQGDYLGNEWYPICREKEILKLMQSKFLKVEN